VKNNFTTFNYGGVHQVTVG